MAWPTITFELYHDFVWNDYSTSVQRFSIDRGRQRLLERHKSGSLTLTLDNSAGPFDPSYNADMRPDMPCRLKVTTSSGAVFQIFGGTTDDFKVTWDGTSSSTCVLAVSDLSLIHI